MVESHPVVFLLDDQEVVVSALARALRVEGFEVRTWTSALAFLEEHDATAPGCLVTDVRMPRMDGLQLQRALLVRGERRPIVFITADAAIATAVQAMKAGAVTFLSKPVAHRELVDAVREALAADTAARAHEKEQQDIAMRLATLTVRERQVLDLVAAGLLNKQIASKLGATEKTIKAYRGRVMEKMKVTSATELVSLLSRAESHRHLLARPPLSAR